MPLFWLGLLLITVFADLIPLFPPQGPQAYETDVGAEIIGLVLPVATLALTTIALFSRYTRSAVLDNLVQDYVRTARAKGASERRVLFGHVLRNSLIPIITLLGVNLPIITGFTLIVEAVFNYPGMGLLFWDSAQTRDFPVLLGVTLIVAIAVVLGNLVADICYAIVDPRVRLA
jgi:peptide/nickel transport system permease protein